MTMYISPYRRKARMRKSMDRFIEENVDTTPIEREYSLAVDVRSDDEAYTIKALVPGLEADDLNIEVLKNTISLRGEFPNGDEEDAKYLTSELPVGRFSRTITLPVEVDSSKAEANMKNGVLMLHVPKAEEHLPKAIKINLN